MIETASRSGSDADSAGSGPHGDLNQRAPVLMLAMKKAKCDNFPFAVQH
jgi:hypothetical protein